MLVAGLWIASMAVGKVVSGAASVAGGAAQTAAQAASGAAADPGARREAQREGQQMGAQAQQKVQEAQAQLEQNKEQIAETAASAGTRGAWAFFLFGALTLAAAAFGGGAGVPRDRRIVARDERAPLPRDRPLSPERV
jgi:hypothetical protein